MENQDCSLRCIGKECGKIFKTKGRYSNHILSCLSYKLYYKERRLQETILKLNETESKLNEISKKEVSKEVSKESTSYTESTNPILSSIQLSLICKGYESLLCFSSIEETNFLVTSCLKKYNMFHQFYEECNRNRISQANGIKILLKQCISLYNPTVVEKIAFDNLSSKEYPFFYPNYLEHYHEKIRWIYEDEYMKMKY